MKDKATWLFRKDNEYYYLPVQLLASFIPFFPLALELLEKNQDLDKLMGVGIAGC